MKHNLMDLYPSDSTPYIAPMWVSFIQWALSDAGVVDGFRQDTGFRWAPGRTPIERMIDEATGAEWRFLEAFVPWANANLWGEVGEVEV